MGLPFGSDALPVIGFVARYLSRGAAMNKPEKVLLKHRKFVFTSSGGYELFDENAETNRHIIGGCLRLCQL